MGMGDGEVLAGTFVLDWTGPDRIRSMMWKRGIEVEIEGARPKERQREREKERECECQRETC